MASDWSGLRNAGKLEVLEKDREGNFLVKNIQIGNTCLVADTFARARGRHLH
ncbi:hypothetical protein MUP79_06105 [Candidatus Bathyarchaeota archaeon]|jgi:hypothetical protein|nr:hypothetical protein [Candidatus Bathyarchaeota archaeon]